MYVISLDKMMPQGTVNQINLQKMKAPSSLAHPSQVNIMDLFTRQQFIQQCCVLWRIQVSQDAL